MLTLDLLDATGSLSPQELGWLREHVLAVASTLRLKGELDIRCIDDCEMAVAHGRFLGVHETTDVMTFDHIETEKDLTTRHSWRIERVNDATSRRISASLLICVDEARRQANKRKILPQIELLLYVTHGILHCLGWDDEAEEEFKQMHALEDAILLSVGVGKVFGISDADKLG